MIVRKFTTSEAAYQRALDIRNRYLRIPLGLNVHDEDLADESDQLHVGLFDDDERLVGCVILKPLGDGLCKLRQMVVHQDLQGRGYGKQLIQGMELLAEQSELEEIEMAARVAAVGFYEKMGYRSVGDIFTEVGIDHIKMVKRI